LVRDSIREGRKNVVGLSSKDPSRLLSSHVRNRKRVKRLTVKGGREGQVGEGKSDPRVDKGEKILDEKGRVFSVQREQTDRAGKGKREIRSSNFQTRNNKNGSFRSQGPSDHVSKTTRHSHSLKRKAKRSQPEKRGGGERGGKTGFTRGGMCLKWGRGISFPPHVVSNWGTIFEVRDK